MCIICCWWSPEVTLCDWQDMKVQWLTKWWTCSVWTLTWQMATTSSCVMGAMQALLCWDVTRAELGRFTSSLPGHSSTSWWRPMQTSILPTGAFSSDIPQVCVCVHACLHVYWAQFAYFLKICFSVFGCYCCFVISCYQFVQSLWSNMQMYFPVLFEYRQSIPALEVHISLM